MNTFVSVRGCVCMCVRVHACACVRACTGTDLRKPDQDSAILALHLTVMQIPLPSPWEPVSSLNRNREDSVSRVVRAHKIMHLAVPGVLQGISFLTIPPIEKSGSITLLYKTVADQSACTLWQEKGNTPEKQVFLSTRRESQSSLA